MQANQPGISFRRLPRLIGCTVFRFATITLGLALLSSTLVAASTSRAAAITGGRATTEQFTPWLASIEYRHGKGNSPWEHGCTGIIDAATATRIYILTAGHCLYDRQKQQYMDFTTMSVVFGFDRPEDP